MKVIDHNSDSNWKSLPEGTLVKFTGTWFGKLGIKTERGLYCMETSKFSDAAAPVQVLPRGYKITLEQE